LRSRRSSRKTLDGAASARDQPEESDEYDDDDDDPDDGHECSFSSKVEVPVRIVSAAALRRR
jgi:hypothetical protein